MTTQTKTRQNEVNINLKSHIDAENIEFMLFLSTDDTYCVKMTDLDNGKLITLYRCIDVNQAEGYYKKWLKHAVN